MTIRLFTVRVDDGRERLVVAKWKTGLVWSVRCPGGGPRAEITQYGLESFVCGLGREAKEWDEASGRFVRIEDAGQQELFGSAG